MNYLSINTYNDIFQVYIYYVISKYGETQIVFDGYEGTSTKELIHQRRAGGRTGATVAFDQYMPVTMKKDGYLANNTNKQTFLLSRHL